jgi:hypothetical protein
MKLFDVLTRLRLSLHFIELNNNLLTTIEKH